MLIAPTIAEQDDPETQDTHEPEANAFFFPGLVVSLARFFSASVTGMISSREHQFGRKTPTSTKEIFNDQDD